MNLLIKKAKIVDPNSTFNGMVTDILIEKGVITDIKANISSKHQAYQADGLHVSPGWFDMHAQLCDPGLEHKEDLVSGLKAAAKGGFTGIAIMPATQPPIDNKQGIEYLLNKAKGGLTDVFPVGCLSEGRNGKNISEMYDMHLAGAVAFSDDKNSIANPELLKMALLYSKSFNGLTIAFPNDENIAQDGTMNEGITSTRLGLKGIPSLAEELMVARDIFLTQYTESKIHFATISSAKSVDIIKSSKKGGINVTCEVAAHHLLLDESMLDNFDSNYKTMPPLRTKQDIKALIKGLKDGTIDCIVSDHSPHDEEMKKREFNQAAFGIIGLETAYAVANTALSVHFTNEEIITKIAFNPRKILGLTIPSIKPGEKANITLFNPQLEWIMGKKDIGSKSGNTPFIGQKLKGKVLAAFNNNQFIIN